MLHPQSSKLELNQNCAPLSSEAPKSVTYSSVVSRDSVRICLLLAGLNDIDIKVADVKLAYLQAPCREKVWTIANEAFFDEEGTFFKIVRALYGLSSSGAAFRSFMANILDELDFKPTQETGIP